MKTVFVLMARFDLSNSADIYSVMQRNLNRDIVQILCALLWALIAVYLFLFLVIKKLQNASQEFPLWCVNGRTLTNSKALCGSYDIRGCLVVSV